MRLPRGFGKKGYFTLASIQASTIERQTRQHHTRLLHTTLFASNLECDEALEDDSPPILLCPLGFVFSHHTRPCACNKVFASRAHSALKCAQKRPKCNCNCRYFSFRLTGIHPPFSLYLAI